MFQLLKCIQNVCELAAILSNGIFVKCIFQQHHLLHFAEQNNIKGKEANVCPIEPIVALPIYVMRYVINMISRHYIKDCYVTNMVWAYENWPLAV